MRTIRPVLLSISAIGVAVFGIAFLISFVRPLLVESVAKELVRREVETRVQERVASFGETRLGRWAMERVTDRKLDEVVSEKVAALVAQIQDSDTTLDLLAGTEAGQRFDRLIRTKYSEVVQALLREFRIFTAANALVFLMLGATAYSRRTAGLQLLLPAVVLVGAATMVGSVYLFGQDWLHTILFSDYVGLGYFAYLGAACVFLIDVVFNHARITTEIVNAALNVIGATIQAVPC